jgi:hypothetical protein
MRKNHSEICRIENKELVRLDRIDKIFFISPFMPLLDMGSTLFSLAFGGKEIGILAGAVFERYGQLGLVVLAVFTSLVCLIYMLFLRFARRRFAHEQPSKLHRLFLAVSVYFFFYIEAFFMGVFVQNLLVPLLLPFLTLLAIQYGVTLTLFVFVIFFTRTEMKRLIRY